MAEERTLYCTNLEKTVSNEILKEVLHEIFTQVGPVESVSVINGATRYGFVQFEDEESVPFAISVMDNLKLYDTPICVRPRANTEQDRSYKEHHYNQRRASAGPSRRESSNAPAYHSGRRSMPVYQHPPNRRSFNERQPPIPLRSIQTPGQQLLQSLVHPPRDPFAIPVRQRTVGGYYAQPPKAPIQGGHQNVPIEQQYTIPVRQPRRVQTSFNPDGQRRSLSSGHGETWR